MDGGGGGTEIQKGLEVERWGISNLSPTKELSMGPFIYVLATHTRENFLVTSSRYISVQIASTVICSRYPLRSDLKSAHISVCAV